MPIRHPYYDFCADKAARAFFPRRARDVPSLFWLFSTSGTDIETAINGRIIMSDRQYQLAAQAIVYRSAPAANYCCPCKQTLPSFSRVSYEQIAEFRKQIERRLDELEVSALVALINAMSAEKRALLLQQLLGFIKKLLNGPFNKFY